MIKFSSNDIFWILLLTNTFIRSRARGFLVNHTRFKTIMFKIYTRFQTKTAQKPYPETYPQTYPEEERPCLSKYWNGKIYFPNREISLALILFVLNLLLIRSFTTGSGTFILSRWSLLVQILVFKNHTLWGGTYLYSLYRGVPPPPPPRVARRKESLDWTGRSRRTF